MESLEKKKKRKSANGVKEMEIGKKIVKNNNKINEINNKWHAHNVYSLLSSL